VGRCGQAGLFEGRNDFTTREMVERYVRPTAKAASCRLLDVPTFPQSQVREALRTIHELACSLERLARSSMRDSGVGGRAESEPSENDTSDWHGPPDRLSV